MKQLLLELLLRLTQRFLLPYDSPIRPGDPVKHRGNTKVVEAMGVFYNSELQPLLSILDLSDGRYYLVPLAEYELVTDSKKFLTEIK